MTDEGNKLATVEKVSCAKSKDAQPASVPNGVGTEFLGKEKEQIAKLEFEMTEKEEENTYLSNMESQTLKPLPQKKQEGRLEEVLKKRPKVIPIPQFVKLESRGGKKYYNQIDFDPIWMCPHCQRWGHDDEFVISCHINECSHKTLAKN